MPGRHRHQVLIRAAVIFALLAAAPVDRLLAAPANSRRITEPRNAATGFAVVLWMTRIDALGDHCAQLGSPSDGEFLQILKAWQGRNMPYVNAALEYMADIEDFISVTQGEAARQELHAARNAEFVASTRKSEAVWFPDGQIDEASCRHLAAFVANGSPDVDQHAEFFPILQELRAEADGKGAP